MRYDKQITFVRFGEKEYDDSTGDYQFSDPVRVDVSASVMDTREQTMNLVYGQLKQGSLTIQIQNHYLDDFDRILVNGKPYRVDFQRKLRTKETFVVSEVQE